MHADLASREKLVDIWAIDGDENVKLEQKNRGEKGERT